MKKNLVILFCCFFILSLVSCFGPNTPEKKDPDNESQKKVKTLEITNNSSYIVDVYYANNPNVNDTIFAKLPAKTTKNVDLEYLTEENGSVFYFVYNLTFGQENIYFPYYPDNSDQNHKVVDLSKDNKITIDEITNCETKSSFLFVENNTSSDFYILLKNSRIRPYKSEDVYIKPGQTGVYEIGENNAGINKRLASEATINMDSVNYALPSITYESGKIYTVTVVNNTEDGATEKIKATLKAVSPFNIDTAKKMWSFSDSDFLYNWDDGIKPVIKTAYSKQDDSIMMGTLKSDISSVGVIKINQYGTCTTIGQFCRTLQNNNSKAETLLNVVDFAEQSDGSIVMLLSYETEEGYTEHMLAAFDFEKKLQLWKSTFPNTMLFRADSANKLLLLEDNKVVVVGAEILPPPQDSNAEYVFSPYVGIFDYTTKTSDGQLNIKNDEGCHTYNLQTTFEKESQFCSAYYDDTNIYVCGFTDFDENYNPANHKGIVYKFDKDLSNAEEIYTQDRCLFFTISGNGNKWYTCGEYCMENKKLLGCYVSSTMLQKDQNANPVYHFGAKENTWFNQLCTYDNMIVMCGQTCKDTKAKDSPLPFVIAFDSEGNELWENLSYKKWATALNIIPNTIGTYILQLTDAGNKQIRFVSADFFGNEVSN